MRLSVAAIFVIFLYLQDEVEARRQMLCPRGPPVCGSNGRTYSNTCRAIRSGTQIACRKPCPCQPDCVLCTAEYQPVCGVNGQTYSNICNAKCVGVNIKCNGQCPCGIKPCPCPLMISPVCGVNGKTYPNTCEATCKKVEVRCNNACPCRYGK
ncbi:serine protease inhibitor dipetalogastin-like [Argopecten irradians]|uniref:serine protease inhibitor dipetalogastin-like n=1 Tax=Argopecten irradians TaxID=31199 RepID=UPI00370FDE9F